MHIYSGDSWPLSAQCGAGRAARAEGGGPGTARGLPGCAGWCCGTRPLHHRRRSFPPSVEAQGGSALCRTQGGQIRRESGAIRPAPLVVYQQSGRRPPGSAGSRANCRPSPGCPASPRRVPGVVALFPLPLWATFVQYASGLYRRVAPDATLREDGQKLLKGTMRERFHP